MEVSRHSLIRYQTYRRLVADVKPTDGLGQLSLSRSVSGQHVRGRLSRSVCDGGVLLCPDTR